MIINSGSGKIDRLSLVEELFERRNSHYVPRKFLNHLLTRFLFSLATSTPLSWSFTFHSKYTCWSGPSQSATSISVTITPQLVAEWRHCHENLILFLLECCLEYLKGYVVTMLSLSVFPSLPLCTIYLFCCDRTLLCWVGKTFFLSQQFITQSMMADHSRSTRYLHTLVHIVNAPTTLTKHNARRSAWSNQWSYKRKGMCFLIKLKERT